MHAKLIHSFFNKETTRCTYQVHVCLVAGEYAMHAKNFCVHQGGIGSQQQVVLLHDHVLCNASSEYYTMRAALKSPTDHSLLERISHDTTKRH